AGAGPGHQEHGQLLGARPGEALRRRPREVRCADAKPRAADGRRTRQAAARAAFVVDDAHHRGMGKALHEVEPASPDARAPSRGATSSSTSLSSSAAGAALAWAPAFTVTVFALPIGAGLLGTLAPAFGYLPAIGGTSWSLDPWRALFAYPGFTTS